MCNQALKSALFVILKHLKESCIFTVTASIVYPDSLMGKGYPNTSILAPRITYFFFYPFDILKKGHKGFSAIKQEGDSVFNRSD